MCGIIFQEVKLKSTCMQRKTIYINYKGDNTLVEVEDTGSDRSFMVYITGEDGHLDLSVRTDSAGNENWYEGDQATPRAKEIGELIELATM